MFRRRTFGGGELPLDGVELVVQHGFIRLRLQLALLALLHGPLRRLQLPATNASDRFGQSRLAAAVVPNRGRSGSRRWARRRVVCESPHAEWLGSLENIRCYGARECLTEHLGR
eukprot:1270771-Pyramimonas_sp.AAC.1